MDLTLETSRIIGLEPPTSSPYVVADEIKAGLPVRSVERLARLIAPHDPSFKYRLVPKATYARRLRAPNGRLSLDESERVNRYASLWAMCMDIWKNEEDARRFLWNPHMLMKGKRPVDLAETSVGAGLVEGMLGRLVHGIPA